MAQVFVVLDVVDCEVVSVNETRQGANEDKEQFLLDVFGDEARDHWNEVKVYTKDLDR